jgi:Tfp pilus assembly protein PilX
MKTHPHTKQQGATLVVGLIMLVVLTLLVVSAMRSSTTNLRIVGNMQVSTEAAAAAQQAIEQIISSNFTVAPAATTVSVDVNGDGTVVYPVAVAKPTCNSTKDLTNADLNANVPEDLVCMGSGTPQNTGIISATGASGTVQTWCSKQQWDVQAVTTDTRSGATATHHQGVSMRVEVGTTC